MVLCQLREAGYEPTSERVDTAECLSAALASREWDIVICDYKMPRFSAPAALALLKNTDLDLPVIVVSGTIGEETAVLAMKAGAHDYVMKNNRRRLVAAIEREVREAARRRAQRESERALRLTEEQLRIAREVQQGLFPAPALKFWGWISPAPPILPRRRGRLFRLYSHARRLRRHRRGRRQRSWPGPRPPHGADSGVPARPGPPVFGPERNLGGANKLLDKNFGESVLSPWFSHGSAPPPARWFTPARGTRIATSWVHRGL